MTREEVRATFPNAVAFADLFRHMGATLKHANEGGREIGKPMESGMDWFQTMPYVRGKS